MRLIGTQCSRNHASVSETVKDRLALVDFDAANDVSMMAEHNVRTGIDNCVRDRPLIGSQTSASMDDAFVERDDDEISSLPRSLNIECHISKGRWIGPFQRCSRRNRSIVGWPHTYI